VNKNVAIKLNPALSNPSGMRNSGLSENCNPVQILKQNETQRG
jgi:hypothetical protein